MRFVLDYRLALYKLENQHVKVQIGIQIRLHIRVHIMVQIKVQIVV